MTFASFIQQIKFHKEEIKKLRELIKNTPEKKQRKRESYKKWELSNPLAKRIYWEKNKDHLTLKSKEWKEKNIDRHKAIQKKWVLANKERVNKERREKYRLKKDKEKNDQT
jgi:hypothetical protein